MFLAKTVPDYLRMQKKCTGLCPRAEKEYVIIKATQIKNF